MEELFEAIDCNIELPIRHLIERGADVNEPNKRGVPPIVYAASRKKKNIC